MSDSREGRRGGLPSSGELRDGWRGEQRKSEGETLSERE